MIKSLSFRQHPSQKFFHSSVVIFIYEAEVLDRDERILSFFYQSNDFIDIPFLQNLPLMLFHIQRKNCQLLFQLPGFDIENITQTVESNSGRIFSNRMNQKKIIPRYFSPTDIRSRISEMSSDRTAKR